jgi:hypothetical protein
MIFHPILIQLPWFELGRIVVPLTAGHNVKQVSGESLSVILHPGRLFVVNQWTMRALFDV